MSKQQYLCASPWRDIVINGSITRPCVNYNSEIVSSQKSVESFLSYEFESIRKTMLSGGTPAGCVKCNTLEQKDIDSLRTFINHNNQELFNNLLHGKLTEKVSLDNLKKVTLIFNGSNEYKDAQLAEIGLEEIDIIFKSKVDDSYLTNVLKNLEEIIKKKIKVNIIFKQDCIMNFETISKYEFFKNSNILFEISHWGNLVKDSKKSIVIFMIYLKNMLSLVRSFESSGEITVALNCVLGINDIAHIHTIAGILKNVWANIFEKNKISLIFSIDKIQNEEAISKKAVDQIHYLMKLMSDEEYPAELKKQIGLVMAKLLRIKDKRELYFNNIENTFVNIPNEIIRIAIEAEFVNRENLNLVDLIDVVLEELFREKKCVVASIIIMKLSFTQQNEKLNTDKVIERIFEIILKRQREYTLDDLFLAIDFYSIHKQSDKVVELNKLLLNHADGLGDLKLIGSYLYRIDSVDGAIQIYKKILSLDSEDLDTLKGLGWLYKKKRRYTKALLVFLKVIKLNPNEKHGVEEVERLSQGILGKCICYFYNVKRNDLA